MVIGSLTVSDIAIQAVIGILPHERLQPQPIVLGFSLELDLEPAACTGDISCTVNYATLAQELSERIVSKQYELLETLVWDLAGYVLDRYPRVLCVQISCGKPQAIPGSSGPIATLKLHRNLR